MSKRPLLFLALSAAAIIGASTALWEGALKERLVPKRWGTVEPGAIYRSGQLSQYLVDRTLREHGVKVVVDLTGPNAKDPNQRAEARAAETLKISRDHYPLRGDGTGDIAQYARAIERIHRAVAAHEPVLVHCSAGAQRTGGVVAMYRVLVEGWPPQRAVAEMRQYGWRDRKNRLLLNYLNEHVGELAEKLVAAGVIAKQPDPLPRLIPLPG